MGKTLPEARYNRLASTLFGGQGSRAPQPTADDLRRIDETSRIKRALMVRYRFKWPWGAGAQYLYRELICALGLEDSQDVLMDLARSKPGRKERGELFLRILGLRKQGKRVSQIQAELERDGIHLSKEGVESYLKTRRRKTQP
ncbi:MAG TPA: hypothetical protein VG204_00780 [Terriglobia bacterium]|nr:hypothetical protein [Terriglobia bacterium]